MEGFKIEDISVSPTGVGIKLILESIYLYKKFYKNTFSKNRYIHFITF